VRTAVGVRAGVGVAVRHTIEVIDSGGGCFASHEFANGGCRRHGVEAVCFQELVSVDS
jgi:hypothetical protein